MIIKRKIFSRASDQMRKATGKVNRRISLELKKIADSSLVNPKIDREIDFISRVNGFRKYANKSNSRNRIPDPTIPGLVFEEIQPPIVNHPRGNSLNPKLRKHKVRGTLYGVDTKGNAWIKDVETKGNSRKIQYKDKESELFDYSEDLTGIKFATRDKRGRLLKNSKFINQ